MLVSGRDWRDDFVYFSDDTLRHAVVSTLRNDGMVIENELLTIKQMQNYGMNVSNDPDKVEEVELIRGFIDEYKQDRKDFEL